MTQPLRQDYLIGDEAELRELFPPTHAIALAKCQDRLDRHARDFIRHDAPSRRVRCVEVVSFGDCLSGPKEKAARSES